MAARSRSASKTSKASKSSSSKSVNAPVPATTPKEGIGAPRVEAPASPPAPPKRSPSGRVPPKGQRKTQPTAAANLAATQPVRGDGTLPPRVIQTGNKVIARKELAPAKGAAETEEFVPARVRVVKPTPPIEFEVWPDVSDATRELVESRAGLRASLGEPEPVAGSTICPKTGRVENAVTGRPTRRRTQTA